MLLLVLGLEFELGLGVGEVPSSAYRQKYSAKQPARCHWRCFVVMAPVSRVLDLVCSHLVSSSGIINNVRTIRGEAPQFVWILLTSCKYCYVVLVIFHVRICNIGPVSRSRYMRQSARLELISGHKNNIRWMTVVTSDWWILGKSGHEYIVLNLSYLDLNVPLKYWVYHTIIDMYSDLRRADNRHSPQV